MVARLRLRRPREREFITRLTTSAPRYSENSNCNYVSTFNGTSSAAPNVSGVIALMLEANPSLNVDRDVKHILATTASTQVDAAISPVSGRRHCVSLAGWTNFDANYRFHPYYGFGGVDATAAVNAAVGYTAGSLGTQTYKGWTSVRRYEWRCERGG